MKDSEKFLWVTREMFKLSLENGCTPVNQGTVSNRVDSEGAAVVLALPVGKLPVRLHVQASDSESVRVQVDVEGISLVRGRYVDSARAVRRIDFGIYLLQR
jgi:hypothetical protein